MKHHVLVICPNPAVDIYAYIPSFEPGVPNRITEEKRYPGGKGLHVGMALSELGLDVTIAGFWGGETGQWIQKSATQYYPNLRFVGPKLEEWTRSCYTFKSVSDFDDTEILGTGPTISPGDYQDFLTSIKQIIPEVHYATLSGSWPKGAPENGYEEVIQICQTANVPTMLDCTGVQLTNGLKQMPTAIHLNRKEITEFFQCNFDEAKKRILEHCQIAAITDGSKGLHLLTTTESYHSLAKIHNVISTIGSGDCLTAGVVAGLVEKMDMKTVANMGAACGAANCLREDLGMLYRNEVLQLIDQLNETKQITK